MSYTVIIPSRFQSTRLPGKPLVDIHGKTMLQRVYQQAQQSSAQNVVIATDDERIMAASETLGADCLMTDSTHVSGTDRLQQAAALLKLSDDDIVVNVQGDEPFIPPENISQVAENLQLNPGASIATLSTPFTELGDIFDPNQVKVVTNDHNEALYFSRAPIPWQRGAFEDGDAASTAEAATEGIQQGNWQRHIGIYAYRVKFLHQFVGWDPSGLELLESLEQLRALSKGHIIHVEQASKIPPSGVDTPDDLELARQYAADNE